MGRQVYQIPEIPLPWKPWFAWRPVRLTDSERLVWLRRIEWRQVWFIYWFAEYREAPR